MLDLSELQKAVATGKKTIVIPEGADDWDLAKIVSFINGAHDITLDLSETKITDLGEAFSQCQALKVIILPKGLTTIGDDAFWGCENLTQVIIPNSVTSIGDSAFGWCTSLTQVKIPESVTNIEFAAFYACMSLTQIVIPASVTSIGVRAFSLCQGLTRIDVASGNKRYSSVDGVLFSKDKKTLVRFPPGKAAAYYEIPSGVTTIWDSAFLGCEALAQVVIPTSVKSIEDFAFWRCTKLADKDGFVIVNGILFDYTRDVSSAVIPAWVTKVYGSAFYLCKNLTRIDVASGNKNYLSVDGILFSKDKKTLVRFPQGKAANYYEIPEGVSAIGAWAFVGIETLRQVTIPNGVTSIGDHAFSGCSGLAQVVIPSGVTSIGENAFIGIEALTQNTFADTSGWYFDKDLTKKAGADVLVNSLKDGKSLYKKLAAAQSANSRLFTVAKSGSAADVRAAIKAGANVNARDENDQTALMYAALANTGTIKPLIDAGADVNARKEDGVTVLMFAAPFNTNPEAIKILVAAGADVNARNKDGLTALMLAVFANTNPDVVTALVDAGADVNAKDTTSQRAIDYLKNRKDWFYGTVAYEKMVDLLY